MKEPNSSHANPREELQQYLRAPLAQQLIYLAVKLGIPDLLRSGARSADDLAQAADVRASALRRVLRGMVSVGLLTEESDATFGLTLMGELLQKSYPGSLYDDALIAGELFPAWCGLIHSVQTGETAFNHVFKDSLFSHFAQHPTLEHAFNRQMAGMTDGIAAAVINIYDFSEVQTIIDIGGGYGTLLTAILERYPAAHGTLFDLPPVVASARKQIMPDAVRAQCDFVAGNFFSAVPKGGDVYLLQVVIHDWNDGQAVSILANCAAAMHKHSRILLIERILPERVSDAPAVVQGDINMLVLTGGRERNVIEYQRLLAGAGLELLHVIPTQSQWSIIEGCRRCDP